ncbi:hypothetical protein [Noviherbaspirillum cavernae]|nr:hypothetical protein [Noviherbaspirillum cavernae]
MNEVGEFMRTLGFAIRPAVLSALLIAIAQLHGNVAHAASGYFDKAYFESQLPPGCTADPAIDSSYIKPPPPPYPPRDPKRRGFLQSDARNQISCRDYVPPAVWPHAHAKEPAWPEPVTPARPQDFDLKNGRATGTDPVASAWFDHLCEKEAGEFYYRKISDDQQPVSVINLRPRQVYIDNAYLFDMYWIEAKSSYFADQTLVDVKYRGGRQYFSASQNRAPGKPHHLTLTTDDNGFTTYKFIAESGEEYSLREWGFFEIKRSSQPLFVERPLTVDEQKKYPDARLMRFEYEALPPSTRVTLINGREVLMVRRTPGPKSGCSRYDYDCQQAYNDKYGEQRPIVTPTNESRAQYGYVWREITRSPEDLRLGITGSETMVVDMRTGEVIALRRNFMRQFVPDKPFIVVRDMRRAAFAGNCTNVTRRRLGDFIEIALGLHPDRGPSPR